MNVLLLRHHRKGRRKKGKRGERKKRGGEGRDLSRFALVRGFFRRREKGDKGARLLRNSSE